MRPGREGKNRRDEAPVVVTRDRERDGSCRAGGGSVRWIRRGDGGALGLVECPLRWITAWIRTPLARRIHGVWLAGRPPTSQAWLNGCNGEENYISVCGFFKFLCMYFDLVPNSMRFYYTFYLLYENNI